MRLRGGTREGWVRTAWPSAELAVSTDRLRITGLGTYDLKPDDVVSIEPYRGYPFLGRGILVRHNRAEYPTTLVFFCNRSVLPQIEQCGFVARGQPLQRASGVAFRLRALVFVALCMSIFVIGGQLHLPYVFNLLFRLVALLGLFAFSTLAQQNEAVQGFALRTGHYPGEILGFLRFVQVVSGMFFAFLVIAFLLGA